MLPRLYREAPLNGIWEGSGNVICLDVLRAMAREPDVGRGILRRGRARRAAATTASTLRRARCATSSPNPETSKRAPASWSSGWRWRCRRSLLVRHGDSARRRRVLRLAPRRRHGLAFGTLPPGFHFTRIIERARPAI